MAPSPFTEDYYLIVGVAQDADKELIVKSYRKRARELHPDCNQGTREATEAFQRLGRAYEILSDEDERSKYDLIYPSIKKKNASHQNPPKRPSHSGLKPQASTPSEVPRIAAL
ncbi:tetratricopeptide [Paraphaeosphaeria sporulosa]